MNIITFVQIDSNGNFVCDAPHASGEESNIAPHTAPDGTKPDGMQKARFTGIWDDVAGEWCGGSWVDDEAALLEADRVAQNVRRIKTKAGEVIYARYKAEKQHNMQARHSELMSIIAGTYPNDGGTFAAARALTTGEQQELVAIKQAWVWVKAVRDTSNAEELLNTPVDSIVWPV